MRPSRPFSVCPGRSVSSPFFSLQSQQRCFVDSSLRGNQTRGAGRCLTKEAWNVASGFKYSTKILKKFEARFGPQKWPCRACRERCRTGGGTRRTACSPGWEARLQRHRSGNGAGGGSNAESGTLAGRDARFGMWRGSETSGFACEFRRLRNSISEGLRLCDRNAACFLGACLQSNHSSLSSNAGMGMLTIFSFPMARCRQPGRM